MPTWDDQHRDAELERKRQANRKLQRNLRIAVLVVFVIFLIAITDTQLR